MDIVAEKAADTQAIKERKEKKWKKKTKQNKTKWHQQTIWDVAFVNLF